MGDIATLRTTCHREVPFELREQLWFKIVEAPDPRIEFVVKGKEERWQPYLASRVDTRPYLSAWL